jgi:hypothetical protein
MILVNKKLREVKKIAIGMKFFFELGGVMAALQI